MADFDFNEQSSGLTIVTPLNSRAQDHLWDVCGDATWHGRSCVVETRYAPELSASLCRDGYSVDLPDGRVVTAADLAP